MEIGAFGLMCLKKIKYFFSRNIIVFLDPVTLDVISNEMDTNNDPFIIFVPLLSLFDPNLSCVYHFIVSFCLETLPLPDDPFKIPQI